MVLVAPLLMLMFPPWVLANRGNYISWNLAGPRCLVSGSMRRLTTSSSDSVSPSLAENIHVDTEFSHDSCKITQMINFRVREKIKNNRKGNKTNPQRPRQDSETTEGP